MYAGTTTIGTEEDYANGFMNTYSHTNFENDFNEYARMIFTHPEEFKRIMDQYPRVRGKFLVFLDFYQMIDPIFTESYLLGTESVARETHPRQPRSGTMAPASGSNSKQRNTNGCKVKNAIAPMAFERFRPWNYIAPHWRCYESGCPPKIAVHHRRAAMMYSQVWSKSRL